MKKIIYSLLICSALLASYVPVTADNGAWKEFYVATNGSDQNPGTKDAPFATVHAAQEAVRAVNEDMQGDIIVNIEEGYYFLDETLDLRPEDSGFNGHRVIWKGAGEDKTVLSGGERVTGFTPSEIPDVYVADYDSDMVLQMSVDGVAAYIAKSASYVEGVRKPASLDTEDWFLENPGAYPSDHYGYYNPETPYQFDGFYMSKDDIGFYNNADDMIFRWDCMFYATHITVDRIEECKEDPSMVQVVMEERAWDAYLATQSNHYPRPNREFHMMNALELLDAPGEFYYDRHIKKLYYMPREGEDIENSVIVASKLNQVMMVEGYDTDKKVEALTFDGITFSDSRMDLLTNPSNYSQAHTGQWNGGDGSDFVTPAIYMDRVNNIEFINNIVRNTGGIGLLIYNGATNVRVEGNVFHDTGDTALAVGAANHSDYQLDFEAPLPSGLPKYGQSYMARDRFSDPVPQEHKDDPVNIAFDLGARIFGSVYRGTTGSVVMQGVLGGDRNSGPDNHLINGISASGGKYAINQVWTSDEDIQVYPDTHYWVDDISMKYGEKAWVRYDFMRPYSIDEVIVSFSNPCVEAGGTGDYEILVSNDRTFAEGTYKVIATQNGEAPEAINRYKYDDDTKYQHLMIRKTTPGVMALSKIWVLTTDQKPWQKRERCAYLTIDNNYISRAAYSLEHGNGMCITDIENSTIKHNRVENIGYTGIATGYQWSCFKTGSWDNEIAYNYIRNVAQNNLDGGGFYNLGPQIGSSLHHNFISRTNQAANSLYTDNGTSYFDIHHNWLQSGRYAIAPYTRNITSSTGVAFNKFYTNFGTFTLVQDLAKDDQVVWEYPIPSIIGQPTAESYDTVANAGLEPEYAHIMDLVPQDVRTFSYHHYDHNVAAYYDENSGARQERIDNTKEELTAVIDNAKFGEGLGMYPTEVLAEVQAMLNYMDDENQSDWAKRFTTAEEFVDDLSKKMNRYSYADTLKMCEDIISAGTEDSTLYEESAFATFKKTVEAVKANSEMSEYARLSSLEEAYNTVMATMSSNKIKNVVIQGADEVIIDDEAKAVTVHMPLTASFVVEDINIIPEGGAKIARVLKGQMDLSKGIEVPVYNPRNGEYATWTVKAITTPAVGGAIEGDVWTTNTNETGFVRGGEDGSVTLCGLDYAYMSTATGGDSKTKMTIKPTNPNINKAFTMILGANKAEDFDYGHKNAEYNHCAVEFTNDTAKFYKVSGGVKTLIDSVYSGIKWNEKNELEYEIKEINDNTHFRIYLNGKAILSEVIQKHSYGRYIGFHTPKTNLTIY